ncbi:hypothetical protein FHX08_001458 [Rhizobium sp. BK529]|nr:hypothetical protein [Rhizobium sp. BK529]TCS08931.1 hypothetical protein EV281_101811 [Rhizobium sp. BK418]
MREVSVKRYVSIMTFSTMLTPICNSSDLAVIGGATIFQ